MTGEDPLALRWRLVLGRDASPPLASPAGLAVQIDGLLEFLYGRESAGPRRGHPARAGGLDVSQLTVPTWLWRVRQLFSASAAETLTRHALQRYRLTELLADHQWLETVTPDVRLLQALLAVRSVLPGHLLSAARRLVQRVVEPLQQALTERVQGQLSGPVDRHRHRRTGRAGQFDAATTVRRNLRHYDRARSRLTLERPYFFAATRRLARWDVVLLVDQSGSMMDAVVHGVVIAAAFRSVPRLGSRLILFDTSVLDLSEISGEPVEVLMRCQLGGGTDIAAALSYAAGLLTRPRQTLVVLISDLFEGGSRREIHAAAAALIDAGAKVLAVPALNERGRACCNTELVAELSALGVQVVALTPDRLAEYVARVVRQ